MNKNTPQQMIEDFNSIKISLDTAQSNISRAMETIYPYLNDKPFMDFTKKINAISKQIGEAKFTALSGLVNKGEAMAHNYEVYNLSQRKDTQC